ncbi:MAG: acyltransferase, partial [Bdellovibrionales bacterium]|nr:acyltransferase [Bdellovibrionales bacterium]
DSIIYEHALLEALGTGTIQVGEGAVLGDIRIASRASVTIGKRCLSSWNVFIQDYDPHPLDPALRKLQVEQMTASFRPSFSQMKKSENTQALKSWSFPSQDIVLGDDVWIGSNVTILKGARIGSGSVIAAGAVVVRGLYPERSLLAGNPARVIREVSPS